MLISPAYAQGFGGGGDLFSFLMPLVLIFLVFWFLLIRPQQQKVKRHQAMLAALRRGDRVVTGGGIIGTITKISPDETELTVEVADNVKVRVLRHTVSDLLSKPEPARAKAAAGAAAGEEKKGGLLDRLGLK
ncbi:MAG: preprotein translocase subunit YajC [Kiloniellales bacterium]